MTVLLIMLKPCHFYWLFVEGRLYHRDNYPALAVLKGYGIYCHCILKPDVSLCNEKTAKWFGLILRKPERLQLI